MPSAALLCSCDQTRSGHAGVSWAGGRNVAAHMVRWGAGGSLLRAHGRPVQGRRRARRHRSSAQQEVRFAEIGWADRPAGQPIASFLRAPKRPGYWEVDVTGFVNNVLSGPHPSVQC